ncbi:MAG: DUF4013 domain-containing protein [Candidatus Nanoarchaeia archaeon]|nr:DUF4013 domain-containing protein [Candidatus Nanoarchaeia archaeon]
MVNYTEGLKRPFTDVKKLLIGIVLSILPIINFFVMGYQLECARSMLKKGKPEYALPEWNHWGNLFLRGFLTLIIGIIYMIPLVIVGILVFGNTLMNLATVWFTGTVTPDLFAGLGAGLAVFILVAILLAYIIPSAIVAFASDYKFGSAFKLGKILKKAFTGKYFGAWFVSIVVSMLFGLVFSIVPYLGGAITSFIVGVIMYSLIGQAYSEA